MQSYAEILRTMAAVRPWASEPREAVPPLSPADVPMLPGEAAGAMDSRWSPPVAERAAQPERPAQIAPCGSPYCSGCYEVAPGVRFHPPKCGKDYLDWFEKWKGKGRVQ